MTDLVEVDLPAVDCQPACGEGRRHGVLRPLFAPPRRGMRRQLGEEVGLRVEAGIDGIE
ncbi:MAG: hypothetical protein R3D80_06740 [Paracoccaceae bacterium]